MRELIGCLNYCTAELGAYWHGGRAWPGQGGGWITNRDIGKTLGLCHHARCGKPVAQLVRET